MTTLETLHRSIEKEYKRIEMLKNTISNGDATWYDFVNNEITKAKNKIAELKKEFNNEYI
jgi:hypothetical protein